jgi:glycerophosphoryl diester phosphodiesterase
MLNIAHRGGAGLRPENTLAAFTYAVGSGADGAELDVQLTKDGEVIVFHDLRLKPEICRTPSGTWIARPTPRIKDLPLAELQAFDVGRPDPATEYGRRHAATLKPIDGQSIPTLAQVIAIAKGAPQPFRLFVELKTSFADRDLSADPIALAEATVGTLRTHDYLEHSVIVGFDWPGLLHVKQIAPGSQCWFTTLAQSWFCDGVPPPEDEPPSEPALQMLRYWAKNGLSPWAGGFDAVKYEGSILKAIKAAGGDGWFPMHRDVTGALVAQARALGLKIGAWTADDAVEIQRLIALGIDAICTDRPDILAGFK